MPTTSSTQEKVLIIEGNAAFGQSLADALTAENYAVTLATDGTQGLKAIYDILPRLIILDIVLPGTDGYEVLTKKHAEPLLAKIPVYLMSTLGIPINMQKVPQGSVNEFIVTFQNNPADIVSKVNSYFQRQPTDAVPATASVGSQKKVLWAEDDKLIGTILSKKLISSGFELHHAQNGEEAIAMSKEMVPDVIVLDLLLPGMSGFDILQKLKMDDRLKKVPSMILSNMNKPSDIEKAKMLGAQKFLVKAGYSLDQIVAEVRELCK